MTYSFTAELWLWEGDGAWHFVSLPEDVADEIEHLYGASAAGFGSLRVEVQVGDTTWRTSVFPDRKRATYVLPMKKAVRAKEGLAAGDAVAVALDVVV
ncbi:MAG: DUF1905 domain-containing protein [Acidimicrobiia bacterium]